MINRLIYRGQLKENKKEEAIKYFAQQGEWLKGLIISGKIITLSVFNSGSDVFLYYECKDSKINPQELFDQSAYMLQAWPGSDEPRYWVPMQDIFHYDKPITDEYWERKAPAEKSSARIVRLKPEMVSSYIYYHYQYQEEKPCDGDKAGIIGINENLLFFYQELPEVKEIPSYKGLFSTSNTPTNWMEVMTPHFIFWENAPEGQEIWKHTDLIIMV
jgi:L-rhamnose mutarotase